MNQRVCLSLFIFLFLWAWTTGPAISGGLNFGLKLSGGVNSLAVGDLNDHIGYWNQYWKDLGIPVEGEFKEIRYGLELEGDLLVLFSPKFGLSIGSGYLYGESKKGESRTVVHLPSYIRTDEWEARASAVPVRVGAYFFLPVHSRVRLFFNAGVGYYFSQMSFYQRGEWAGVWLTIDNSTKGKDVGFHGGLGIEFVFSRNISLVVEGFGRYAKMRELRGHMDWTPSWLAEGVRTEGRLYYYESLSGDTGVWYPYIDILESAYSPSPSIRNVRKAMVDFSGCSLRLGLKITI